MPSSKHANRTGEKLGLTFLSAHFGPSRKLITLTEVRTVLQVRDGKTNARAHTRRTIAPEVNGKMIFWSRRRDLNPRPTDYKSVALPTELHRQAPRGGRPPWCSRHRSPKSL